MICPFCNELVESGEIHAYHEECKIKYDKEQCNTLKPIFPISDRGWICPKCDRVYSPSSIECFHCNTLLAVGLIK